MWLIFQAVQGLLPITLLQRQGGDRVFIDSAGRERIFHGTNAVVKGPPWHPDPYTFSADISMAKEDFEWMQRLGLNVVRLGVLWSGVEPTRGHYNETYLDQLDMIVTLAAAHGVYTLLDWHQDGISEHFCGEGAPSWAIRRAEQPQLRYPFPFAPAFNDSSLFYVEEKMGGAPTLPTRSACIASHASSSASYLARKRDARTNGGSPPPACVRSASDLYAVSGCSASRIISWAGR